MSQHLKKLFQEGRTSLQCGLRRTHQYISRTWKHVSVKLQKVLRREHTSTPVTSIPDLQQGFLPVTSRFSILRDDQRKEKKLLALIVGLCLCCMLLFCGIISLAIIAGNKNLPKICHSQECIASAAMLIANIDPRENPCNDFYAFACGRWPNHHPIPDSQQSIDWFLERKISVKREIRDVLMNSLSIRPSEYEPFIIKQMRTLFADCLDTETINLKQLEPLRTLLLQLSLSLRPSYLDQGARGKVHPNFSISMSSATAKRLAGLDILVASAVYPDPLNNSRNIFGLASPNWRSPLPAEANAKLTWRLPQRPQLRNYFYKGYPLPVVPPKRREVILRQKYMANMIKVLLESGLENDLNSTAPFQKIGYLEDAVMKIYDLESKLYTLANLSIADVDYSMMSIDELQNTTDTYGDNKDQNRMMWQDYFTQLFLATNMSVHNIQSVQVQLSYVQNLADLLSKTSPALVEALIWWQIVDVAVPYLPLYIRAVRRSYIEDVTSGQAVMSRSMICAGVTNDLLGMAVSYLFASPSFVQNSEARIGQMIEDIRSSFIKRVHQLDWMDSETRKATLQKVNAMKVLIAFPKWMLKNGELDKYYGNLVLTPGNYFMNVLTIMKASTQNMLKMLNTSNSIKMETWASDPTDVNAYYAFQENAITIPAAILQFPFYNMGLEVLNYGAIGSILGHELTHGFDNLGRLYDDLGNFRPWWTNTTSKEYLNRTSCFVEQYSKYRIAELHTSVNGYLTLGENIADNGGIQEAILAYSKLKERHNGNLEDTLPGLEYFKPEQLLYLAYANLWCDQATEIALKWSIKGNHAPNRARIWGSLSNTKHFAETWNCPLNTPMNPQQKCELW